MVTVKQTRRSLLKQCPLAAGITATAVSVSAETASAQKAGTKPAFLAEIGVVLPIEEGALAQKHGYSFIEETIGHFLIPDKPEEQFQANLALLQKNRLPLPAVNMFLPAGMKSVGPSVEEEAIMKWADTTFRRMKQAGIQIIVFGSGGSRRIPDGFDKGKARTQFIQLNRRLGPLAKKYGVTLVLEPLNYGETNLLNTVEEGLAMAIEVNHPSVKLLADIFHMLRNNETPDGILKAGNWLRHVHVAEKERRTAPGVAGDNFRPYLQALRKIKYRGRIAIEAFKWGDKEKELPVALQELRKQIG